MKSITSKVLYEPCDNYLQDDDPDGDDIKRAKGDLNEDLSVAIFI